MRQPRRSLTSRAGGLPVTWTLIGLNLAVFVLLRAVPDLVNWFTLHAANFCTVGAGGYVGMSEAQCHAYGSYVPGVDGGAYWELVTTMFTHQAVWHIAGNMISLWMIGPLLEQGLGTLRYVAAYVGSGLAASALVLALSDPATPTLGASGAIFGLLGVLVVLFIRRGLPLQQLGVILLINFFITFSVPGISWEGHVGGFAGGLVIGALYAYTPLGRR